MTTSRSEYERGWVESAVLRGDYESLLRNLLAVIHRDGGHYTERHGLAKSVLDALTLSAKRLP